jgi:hypothetical protein
MARAKSSIPNALPGRRPVWAFELFYGFLAQKQVSQPLPRHQVTKAGTVRERNPNAFQSLSNDTGQQARTGDWIMDDVYERGGFAWSEC